MLYKLAKAALEAVALELYLTPAYVPAGFTDYRFVSFSEPAWDCCPALSVFVSNLHVNPLDLARMQEGRMCCPSTYQVDLTFVILGCYITQDPSSGIDATLLDSEAQSLDAIGLIAWSGFLCQWRSGGIVTQQVGECPLAWMGPLEPLGPESGCAGWRFTITVNLD